MLWMQKKACRLTPFSRHRRSGVDVATLQSRPYLKVPILDMKPVPPFPTD